MEHLLQKTVAYTALFLLPLSALNFGVSFTCADPFLILAVLLNAGEVVRIRAFQIPFLLAIPFFLVSSLLDPDCSLTAIVQTLYLWGFVMPFGWMAFTRLPKARIAQVLLASFALSSFVAVGQAFGCIPEIGHQVVVSFFGGSVNRAAGLSILCNELAAGLTSVLLLLPYIKTVAMRSGSLLSVLAGMLATMSKSNVLALPGLCYYFWQEPRKKHMLLIVALFAFIGSVATGQLNDVDYLWASVEQLIDHRREHLDGSFDERLEVIRYGMDYVAECVFLGYGIEGAQIRFTRDTTHTVHMYYLGLIVITGIPGALLWCSGVALILHGLWKPGDRIYLAYFLAHLLACLVLPVINLSVQSLPLMVAGAVAVRSERSRVSSRGQKKNRARSSRPGHQRRAA